MMSKTPRDLVTLWLVSNHTGSHTGLILVYKSLSKVPCAENFDLNVNDVENLSLAIEYLISPYQDHQVSGPIFNVLQDEWPFYLKQKF